MKRRVAIITIAGESSRFAQSLGLKKTKLHKSIYTESSYKDTLLYFQISILKENNYDIIIVTGHCWDRIKKYVIMYFGNDYATKKIKLVYNKLYLQGSESSLVAGLQYVIDHDPYDEILFVEGDLHFDKKSIKNITRSTDSVLTYNTDLITAETSVAVYIKQDNSPKFIYDTEHNSLYIAERFKAIYNSAQIWKFTNMPTIKYILKSNKLTGFGTNLNFIQPYFEMIDTFKIMQVDKWKNCNTVSDYRSIFQKPIKRQIIRSISTVQ